MYRWWNKTGLGHKLHFIRDRLATSFLWAVGISSKPQHRYFKIQIAKVIQLITALDDVYDVYATLDELEAFTSVIERFVVYIYLNLLSCVSSRTKHLNAHLLIPDGT